MHDTRQWREQSSYSSSCILTTIPCKNLCSLLSEKVFQSNIYRSHYYPDGMIACGLCLIWQPSFVKNYSACCSRHSEYVCFNRFISRIENKFKQPWSDRGFVFEGFFQKSLHFHQFLSSHSDLFFQQLIYLFFAFCKVFSTSHSARGIVELIAWTTSFLEKRLDFEITWLIWNAINLMMSPPWPKDINLYLIRLLLIQNTWRMNLI